MHPLLRHIYNQRIKYIILNLILIKGSFGVKFEPQLPLPQSFARQIEQKWWGGDLTPLNYTELALEFQNNIREEHSTPPLQLNFELSERAIFEAERLLAFITPDTNSSSLAQPFNMSQNVHFRTDSLSAELPSVAAFWASVHWYDYEPSYNPQIPSHSPFTRMLWKSSTDMGVGVATNERNMTVVVANYYPPPPDVDNLSEEEKFKVFRENVLDLKEMNHTKYTSD